MISRSMQCIAIKTYYKAFHYIAVIIIQWIYVDKFMKNTFNVSRISILPDYKTQQNKFQ